MDELEKLTLFTFMRDAMSLLILIARPQEGHPAFETEQCLRIEAERLEWKVMGRDQKERAR